MKRIIIAAVLLTGCAAAPSAAQTQPDTAADTVIETTVAKTETERRTERETEPPQEMIMPEYIPAGLARDALIDITLQADKDELLTDENAEIIWSAIIPTDSDPEVIGLIDADTGETAAVLNDIANFNKYGGDIMGDGVYNCRFVVDMDINTDDDVSEQHTYRYYAEFEDEAGLHRSDIKEITIYEPFTEKELGDMEAVDSAVKALMEDAEYGSLDVGQKTERMLALLHGLAKNGTPERPYPLIIDDSITDETGGMIDYTYACGIGSGVMLVPFSEHFNSLSTDV